MNAHERAAKLMEDAIPLGCDTPTETMIADALHNHEHDAYHRVCTWLRRWGHREAAVSVEESLKSQTFLSNIHKD